MNRSDYLELHKQFCDKARELSARKNSDYAGHAGDKPFANFEGVEAMGITSTERGFLVRMTDKLSRLSTFCDGGIFEVKDESVEDTCMDLVNYAILFYAFVKGKKDGHVDQIKE